MGENLDRPKRLSKGKAMLAAIGMTAAAEAAVLPEQAHAQNIYQYSHEGQNKVPDSVIASLPKETTVRQAAGPGETNVLDGAKLDPKITHIYQTTRGGGKNLIVNADKIRKDVVIIQEGNSNMTVLGEHTNSVIGTSHGNVITGGNSGTITINGNKASEPKMPDTWPFTDKGNPFKGKDWPFNK